MANAREWMAALAAALLLAACGGGEPVPPKQGGHGPEAASATPAIAASPARQGAAAAQYHAAMHAIYMGYFGRPPDTGGLDWYAGNLAAFQAPTDLAGLAQAYGSNGGVKDLIDSFGNSAESRSLYGGDNLGFITAIYANVFGRQPDPAGLAYWLDLLNRGAITRGNAVLTIMAGAREADQQFLIGQTRLSTAFVQALDTPDKVAAYSGPGAVAVVRAALRLAAADLPALPTDFFQRLADTLVALPRSVTGAPPAVAAIVPALLSRGALADGTQVAGLSAGRLLVAAQQTGAGVTEIVADSGDGKVSLALTAGGAAMFTDAANKLSVLTEPGPKGTLVRVYDDARRYQAGYFIETGAGGRRTLWRLIADGSTEPSNLTAGRVLPGLARTVQGGPRLRQGDTTCYGFISGITGGMADHADDMGDALDDDGRSAVERRVGRGARFLGNLFGRIANLCPDAPNPVSDADFMRETALESIKAIDEEGGWRKAIEKYQSWRDLRDQLQERARALRAALSGLADGAGGNAGAGLQVPWQLGQGSLSPAPAAAIGQQLEASQPAIIYVSGSINCVATRFAGDTATFNNNCGIPVTVHWCFSSGPVCLSDSAAYLDTGGSTSSASFGRSYVWSSACPQTVAGREVHLREEAGSQYFYCYYYSR